MVIPIIDSPNNGESFKHLCVNIQLHPHNEVPPISSERTSPPSYCGISIQTIDSKVHKIVATFKCTVASKPAVRLILVEISLIGPLPRPSLHGQVLFMLDSHVKRILDARKDERQARPFARVNLQSSSRVFAETRQISLRLQLYSLREFMNLSATGRRSSSLLGEPVPRKRYKAHELSRHSLDLTVYRTGREVYQKICSTNGRLKIAFLFFLVKKVGQTLSRVTVYWLT